MTSLANRLRQAREAAGLSQSELARRVGIKPQSIQAIETGKVVRTRYVQEIAQALSVETDWLATGYSKERFKNQVQLFFALRDAAGPNRIHFGDAVGTSPTDKAPILGIASREVNIPDEEREKLASARVSELEPVRFYAVETLGHTSKPGNLAKSPKVYALRFLTPDPGQTPPLGNATFFVDMSATPQFMVPMAIWRIDRSVLVRELVAITDDALIVMESVEGKGAEIIMRPREIPSEHVLATHCIDTILFG